MTVPASTAALQADWRRRLRSTCKSLSDADLAEVEAHLQDSLEDLKTRGLSEEEAFLIAARRLGQPEMIEAEFAKKGKRYPFWSWFWALVPGILALSWLGMGSLYHAVSRGRNGFFLSLGANYQEAVRSVISPCLTYAFLVALPFWLAGMLFRPLRPVGWRVMRIQLLIWAAYWSSALALFNWAWF